MSTTVYVATQEAYHTDSRGNTKVYPVGTILKAKEYNALSSEHAKAKFAAEERQGRQPRNLDTSEDAEAKREHRRQRRALRKARKAAAEAIVSEVQSEV